MFNQTIIIGHVGKDPQVKTFPAKGNRPEGKVASYSLAVSKKWKDRESGEEKEVTTWFKVQAWNGDKSKDADFIETYIRKGMKLCVVGEVSAEAWTNDDGETKATLVIKPTHTEFCSEKPTDGYSTEAKPGKPASKPSKSKEEFDDDIPF